MGEQIGVCLSVSTWRVRGNPNPAPTSTTFSTHIPARPRMVWAQVGPPPPSPPGPGGLGTLKAEGHTFKWLAAGCQFIRVPRPVKNTNTNERDNDGCSRSAEPAGRGGQAGDSLGPTGSRRGPPCPEEKTSPRDRGRRETRGPAASGEGASRRAPLRRRDPRRPLKPKRTVRGRPGPIRAGPGLASQRTTGPEKRRPSMADFFSVLLRRTSSFSRENGRQVQHFAF